MKKTRTKLKAKKALALMLAFAMLFMLVPTTAVAEYSVILHPDYYGDNDVDNTVDDKKK